MYYKVTDFTGFFIVEIVLDLWKLRIEDFQKKMEITEKYGERELKVGVEETFPFDQIKMFSFVQYILILNG